MSDMQKNTDVQALELETKAGRERIRKALEGATADDYYYALLVRATVMLDRRAPGASTLPNVSPSPSVSRES